MKGLDDLAKVGQNVFDFIWEYKIPLIIGTVLLTVYGCLKLITR